MISKVVIFFCWSEETGDRDFSLACNKAFVSLQSRPSPEPDGQA